ncbi:alpha/beta fold hydrolase [Alkalihalobacterium alkalinitrilicum]|uniref:alpha/beta fold hydrolase n=1 Tax=Alkalihalobacterium alkalinitrilicum TaxID=427920 RepID=UPI0009954DB3|nr:alpha/beta hydrolase [Alkalihalobacterium alkalinitrilicum]
METRIACVEGRGPNRVLVLHGWALDSGIWLASRSLTDLDNFTYAYMDFPGYGTNRTIPPCECLDSMAKAALNAADELGWDRFMVLGHSMGGATAIRVATLAPGRVMSVVALTPVSAEGTPLPDNIYNQYANAWSDPGAALHSLAPNLSSRQLANIVSRCHETMDHNAWKAYLANWTGANFIDNLGAFNGPTTVLYGGDDPLVNPDYLSRTMDGLHDGTLVGIDGAGHYPMVEQTEATVQLWEKALTDAAVGAKN